MPRTHNIYNRKEAQNEFLKQEQLRQQEASGNANDISVMMEKKESTNEPDVEVSSQMEMDDDEENDKLPV